MSLDSVKNKVDRVHFEAPLSMKIRTRCNYCVGNQFTINKYFVNNRKFVLQKVRQQYHSRVVPDSSEKFDTHIFDVVLEPKDLADLNPVAHHRLSELLFRTGRKRNLNRSRGADTRFSTFRGETTFEDIVNCRMYWQK